VASALFMACVAAAGSNPVVAQAHSAGDPPLLVPWSRIGNIALGESRTRVEREYGSVGHGYHVIQRFGDNVQGYYRLHGDEVIVTFYGNHVASSSSGRRTTGRRPASESGAGFRLVRVTGLRRVRASTAGAASSTT
jgi:hypothetical protein